MEDKEAARLLIKEFSCVFLRNDLNLWRTTVVKYIIKLNDYTPLKNIIGTSRDV